MTICDLTQFYSPVGGGVRRYLSEKTKHLNARGDRHILIVPGEKTECQHQGLYTVYSIESPLVSRTARYRILTNLNLIEEILEREKPDLIESGDPYQIAWKAIASGRGLHIPVVGFYHSHFPEAIIRSTVKYFGGTSVLIAEDFARRYLVSLYNRFARTLVPHPGLAALLTEWGVENATTLELGMNHHLFYPHQERGEKMRSSIDFEQERQLLLYIGRLSPEKNVRLLLETFAHLHERYPGRYHLLVVGDGTLRPLLQRFQESTGEISWRPYCQDPEELADYYRAADLFIHPAIHETFGLVTLESQGCGTPVIGVRGSNMDRIVFSGIELWAREQTKVALAASIFEASELLREGKLDHQIAKAASYIRDNYGWNRVFERLFAIYENVILAYNT